MLEEGKTRIRRVASRIEVGPEENTAISTTKYKAKTIWGGVVHWWFIECDPNSALRAHYNKPLKTKTTHAHRPNKQEVGTRWMKFKKKKK